MRLPANVSAQVHKAGVRVYFAGRGTTKHWNSHREKGDLLSYGGWYWHRFNKRGVLVDYDKRGPFRSEQAAIRDAFVSLQLSIGPCVVSNDTPDI